MSVSLRIADHATRDDLKIYLERLLRVGRAEVRIVTRGPVLAVFGCTQAPEGITDPVPVILVLRAFGLAHDHERPIDLVVTARALLDRITRMGRIGLDLELPETEVTVAWAGILPPTDGWQVSGAIDTASLSEVAEAGIRRIASALPDAPGDAVVRRVRREVWGSEIAPGLPAAAAFAAESLGFLGARDPEGPALPARFSETLTWKRLAMPRGEVLIRTLLG